MVLGFQRVYIRGIMLENQMENELETGVNWGFAGVQGLLGKEGTRTVSTV